MMITESERYWIWLSSFSEIRSRTVSILLSAFGDAEGVYRADSASLDSIRGISRREAQMLREKDLSRTDRILLQCENQHITPLLFTQEIYPARLRNIFAPPAVLYVKGRLPSVDDRAVIAIIGTRKGSSYGIRMGRRISSEIVQSGGIVVSLLTPGIDLAVAEAAVSENGCCIAVLGTAHESYSGSILDRIVENGAVVTEYPPGTPPLRTHFRERNRIAAGLSVGTVVVEAPLKSGTRLFVQEALEQNKDIYAVPGNADSELSSGTLELLRSGAKPVASGWDVLSEYASIYPGLSYFEPEKRDSDPGAGEFPETEIRKNDAFPWMEKLESLTIEQRQIIQQLTDSPRTTEELIEMTGIAAARILSQLTILEIKGIIKRDEGRRVSLKKHE